VTGTGPHGRIVKSDIENALKAPKPTKPTTIPANDDLSFDVQGLPSYTLQAHTTMRKVIARRLSESKQTVPHFYLNIDITLDKLLSLRKDINAQDESQKITVNDMLIRACGLALRRVPEANAAWFEDGVHLFDRADISVAVAIEGGLITPIVRGACAKRLPEISTTMKDLGARAKAGKLKPEEFTGGTFSLSNLGMFGISNFAAIINPPQGCILAVGAGEERAVVKNGQLAIANQMTCTLSVDHRVVDGAVGAAFLSALKELIEKPLGLVL
jgi:pyruvate dehydrogenase E2 component (dihydrolipoamide acetyltransferase)